MDLKLVVLAWVCLTTVAEGAAIDETALLDKRSNSNDLAASPLVSVLIQMIQRVEDDLEGVETDLNDKIDGLDSKINGLSFRLSVSCHDKTTTASSDGGGKMYYLDRHGVDCGTGYLAYFRLGRPDSGKVQYNYRCCSVTQTKG